MRKFNILKISLAVIVYSFLIIACCSNCIGKYHINSMKNNYTFLKRNLSFDHTPGFGVKPSKTTFENNGHTVVVKYTFANVKPKIQIQSVSADMFEFEYLQYNWLNDSGNNDNTNPPELHLIFRNERYGSYEQASNNNFGILILSYRHEIYNLPLTDMDSYYEAFDKIVKPHTSTVVLYPDIEPLYHFGITFFEYYMYVGKSIGTQGNCHADVIWLDFLHNIRINITQMEHFNNLLAFDGTPLMSKTFSYSPPNSSIYQTVNLAHYKKMGLVAKPFEGFSSHIEGLKCTNLHIFILLAVLHWL